MGLLDALGLAPAKKPPPATGAAPLVSTKAKAPSAAPAPSPQELAFTVAHAGVQALVDALNAHPQKAYVQPLITQAIAKIAEADGHAAKGEWPQAVQSLTDARNICVSAKKYADDKQTYATKRANAVSQLRAMQGVIDATAMTPLLAVLTAADTFANAAPPNFASAIAKIDSLDNQSAAIIQSYLTSHNATLARLAAMSAEVQKFIAPDVAQAKTLVATAQAAFGAKQWSQSLTALLAAIDVLSPAERMAGRRNAYELARAPVVAAIAAVKGNAATSDRGPGLNAELAKADAAASHDSMQFESGTAILVALAGRCKDLVAAAGDIGVYRAQRPLADAEMAALDAHAAAAKIAAPRDAARKLLVAAAASAATAAAATVKPGEAWTAAVTAVVRVRADMAAAKKLADGLGAAVAAQTAAGAPGDVAAMKKALQALKTDGAAAAAAPFAAEAAQPLKQFKDEVAKAEQALAKNDGKGAAKPMAQAAQALVDAKAIQEAHAQYAATLPTVEAELKKLQGSASAASLKGRIEPVVAAIADAKAKDKAHNGLAAIAALRGAADLAAIASKADADRLKFDTAAATSATAVAGVADPKAKKALEGALADAKKLADGFRFDDAAAALKRIDVGVDKAALQAAASANPADPKIATLAANMTANGGSKDVDALIKDKKTTDPNMIASLAQGRYGVQFQLDGTPGVGPREATAMKALCEAFAKVPKDVAAHGSITSIQHTDSSKKEDISGAWSSDATVTLTGRPNLDTQGFGTDLESRDHATGKKVKQLPKNIDKDCQATGKPAELLSFTALHEVGHGVDDANTYMARNGQRADHGGWIQFGNSVQPIADAVAADIVKKTPGTTFYGNAADKAYVLAKILNQDAPRRAPPLNTPDWKALKAFDDWYKLATSSHVYERQGDCDALTIGNYIYHEAYPRNWVGYLADARSKGLTGYQFRAPGEWFAELYAGFHSKRLGPKHPARAWLEKL